MCIMAKSVVSKLYKLILLLSAIIFVVALTSCDDLLFEDISERVKASLDTACVESVSIHDYAGTNSSGIDCFSYMYPGGIHVTVRNPRNFNLRAHYNLLSGVNAIETYYSSYTEYAAVPSTQKSDISIYPSASDRNQLEIDFSSNFLKASELGNRDISGNIVLYDYDTTRFFEPYPVHARANSLPPSVSTVMVQRSSANGQYILCFYFPKVCDIDEVHSDTHMLIINNTAYYFKTPTFDGKFYTSPSYQTECTSFTTTRPTGMLPLSNNSESFPDYSYTDYVPVFFYTGDGVTTTPLTYTIYVEDDEGLHGTPDTVSNIEKTLATPTVNTESNGTYYTDNDGYYSIVVSHNGMCLDGTSAGSVEIRYVVTYADGSSSAESSAGYASPNSPATIHLSSSTYSEIAIYAKKSGCVPSDTVTISNITVRRSPNFFVSATGSDSNDGTTNAPLRTIQGAITKFNEVCSNESTCNIYLLSNITPSSDDFVNGITSLVTLSAGTENSMKTYNIMPYSSGSGTTTYTINANRNENQLGCVISVAEYNTLNLTNLTISGGRTGTNTNGGGIYVGSNATVTLTNCTVSNNHVLGGNGGGIFNDGGSVTLNGCTVTGNSASQGGGGIFNSSGTVTLNSCTITSNIAGYGGGGVYNVDMLKISGNVNVTGNTGETNGGSGSANNIYLEDGKYITITGSLNSSSHIGVTTYIENEPTATDPITFTSGFSANSGLSVTNARNVFVCDKNPGFVVIQSGNELALSPSGGNIGGNALDYSITLSGPSYVSVGATLTVNATIMNGETVVTPLSSELSWDIRLKDIGGTAVGISSGGTVFTNGGSNRLPIPQEAQIYEGETYRLDVTVTYTPTGWTQSISGSAQFVLQVPVEYSFHGTVTTLSGADANGSAGSSATYVYFGDWPQTIKAANVNVDESQTLARGGFTYYKGDDGNWYAKQQEMAYATGYSYSDGTTVAQSSENSYKYFKVEPIKWRVVTTDYNGTGKKLLLAENILISGTFYDNRDNRTINESTVYPNNYEHSRVRAYLNGLNYNKSGETCGDYSGKGFLQTAFTSAMQGKIVATTVDNSAESTTDAGENLTQATNYVCSDTNDKVFLLSEKEVTTTSYGFGYYSAYDSARLRKPTDFALSSGVFTNQFTNTSDGGIWWLRSPSYNKSYYSLRVYNDGKASSSLSGYVDGTINGILPALCLDN